MRYLVIVIALALGSGAARADIQLKGTLVTVWEDAKLHIAPSSRSPSVRAAEKALPRAKRTYLETARNGEWVAVQTISTFDTGRLTECPLPGLSSFSIRFWVHERDVAGKVDASSIPKKLAPVIELQLDGCRNSLATGVVGSHDRVDKKDNLQSPIASLIPYLRSGTSLYWKDGTRAGQVRFDVPVPDGAYGSSNRKCFEQDAGASLMQPASHFERMVTLCVEPTAIRQN